MIAQYKLYHVSLYQRKVDYSNRHALHFLCFSIVLSLYRSTFEDSSEALANITARLLTAYLKNTYPKVPAAEAIWFLSPIQRVIT